MSKNKKKEKKLASLKREYERLRHRLDQLGYVIPGTMICRQYRCGKPTCRCARDPKYMHGPYYQWTRKIKGKTVTINLDKNASASVKRWTENDRRLYKIIARLHRIAEEILALENDIETR